MPGKKNSMSQASNNQTNTPRSRRRFFAHEMGGAMVASGDSRWTRASLPSSVAHEMGERICRIHFSPAHFMGGRESQSTHQADARASGNHRPPVSRAKDGSSATPKAPEGAPGCSHGWRPRRAAGTRGHKASFLILRSPGSGEGSAHSHRSNTPSTPLGRKRTHWILFHGFRPKRLHPWLHTIAPPGRQGAQTNHQRESLTHRSPTHKDPAP